MNLLPLRPPGGAARARTNRRLAARRSLVRTPALLSVTSNFKIRWTLVRAFAASLLPFRYRCNIYYTRFGRAPVSTRTFTLRVGFVVPLFKSKCVLSLLCWPWSWHKLTLVDRQIVSGDSLRDFVSVNSVYFLFGLYYLRLLPSWLFHLTVVCTLCLM